MREPKLEADRNAVETKQPKAVMPPRKFASRQTMSIFVTTSTSLIAHVAKNC